MLQLWCKYSGQGQRLVRAALTEDARFGFAEHLVHAIVVTEALARTDLLPAQLAGAA